ncbi:hypothetical protein [Marinobacter subterrani]|uniref:hypothetical protein n=1 Tax=Marinobacter subterrani TaxID=1658765 RepID=UPI0018CE832E|nr:hypothetical protein [Marinobacter subterrani]
MKNPKSPPQTAIQKAKSKVTRHPQRASSQPLPKVNPPRKTTKGKKKAPSKKQKAKSKKQKNGIPSVDCQPNTEVAPAPKSR